MPKQVLPMLVVQVLFRCVLWLEAAIAILLHRSILVNLKLLRWSLCINQCLAAIWIPATSLLRFLLLSTIDCWSMSPGKCLGNYCHVFAVIHWAMACRWLSVEIEQYHRRFLPTNAEFLLLIFLMADKFVSFLVHGSNVLSLCLTGLILLSLLSSMLLRTIADTCLCVVDLPFLGACIATYIHKKFCPVPVCWSRLG